LLIKCDYCRCLIRLLFRTETKARARAKPDDIVTQVCHKLKPLQSVPPARSFRSRMKAGCTQGKQPPQVNLPSISWPPSAFHAFTASSKSPVSPKLFPNSGPEHVIQA